MASDKSTSSGGAKLGAIVENPARLRLALTATLLLIWCFAVHAPLNGAVEEHAAKSTSERKRVALAKEIDHLRRENARVAGRLPVNGDQNEWIAFLMNRIRSMSLKLVSLEPRPPAAVGPYQVVSFRLSVEGSYSELERLLRDLETSPRLIRIESVKIAPRIEDVAARAGGGNKLEMHLAVLGVIDPSPSDKTGKAEKPKSAAKSQNPGKAENGEPKGSKPRS